MIRLIGFVVFAVVVGTVVMGWSPSPPPDMQPDEQRDPVVQKTETEKPPVFRIDENGTMLLAP